MSILLEEWRKMSGIFVCTNYLVSWNRCNTNFLFHVHRETCITKLNKNSFIKKTDSEKLTILDVCAILDCILDDASSCPKLTLNIPYPSTETFAMVMQTIAHRSPHLEELNFCFIIIGFAYEVTNHNTQTKEACSVKIPERCLFQCLTVLTFSYSKFQFGNIKENSACGLNGSACTEAEECRDSFFSIIGKLCPVLVKLRNWRFCINKMDILALIVKEDVADILFPKDNHRWSEDSTLGGLQFPSEFLNPLCFTLKELLLVRTHWICIRCGVPESSNAFALRHLRKLEVAKLVGGTVNVVKLLYQMRFVHQRGFEASCMDACSRLGLHVSSRIVPVSFFSGKYIIRY